MKKITKLTKIFLVFVTIFSQLSSVVKVLADEITTKPLSLILEQNLSEDNSVANYTLTYKSENKDYEEVQIVEGTEIDKTYDIVLSSTFTYLNNEVTTPVSETIEDVTGKTLNNTTSTYEIDPISKYYDGTFTLSVKVLDETKVLFETKLTYLVNNTVKGLKGTLNSGEVLPTNEVITSKSVANYAVTEGKEYTTSMKVMPGELSPNGNYKIKYSEDNYSEVMTGEELRNKIIVGNNTVDLTSKLSGNYKNSEQVTIVEVSDEEEIINTYLYSYDASIEYTAEETNNEVLTNIYESLNIEFIDNLFVVSVPELLGKVPTIGEIKELLPTDYSLKIEDNEGNQLDLETEEVLASEVANNYKITFINGAEEKYTVVIFGDATDNNHFEKEDLIKVQEAFINEELLPSMDGFYDEENERPYSGNIDFEDVMFFNELLKEEPQLDVIPEDNVSLYLTLGNTPEKIYVGDTFTLDVVLNTNNTEQVKDYIDGIVGSVALDSKLQLVKVTANSNFNVAVNDMNRFVATGNNISENNEVVLTLTFNAQEEGTSLICLTDLGIAKYLNIKAIDDLEVEVEIIKNLSTDNNLSSLTPSVGKLDREFDSNVTIYTLTVPNDTEKVILSGSLSDINSTVEGLIEYTLTEEKTVANIIVTAEDGSQKVYTVYIVKEQPTATPITYNYYYSSNNYLKSLEIKNYEIDFSKDVTEYAITVDYKVTSLDITAIAEVQTSRVEITGNESFKEGKNTVLVTVTAEDGSQKVYTITVNKEAKSEPLDEVSSSNNTTEKIVIIILIILVVLGLLYLIFKKDEEVEEEIKNNSPKKEENSKEKSSKQNNTKKNNSKNNKK